MLGKHTCSFVHMCDIVHIHRGLQWSYTLTHIMYGCMYVSMSCVPLQGLRCVISLIQDVSPADHHHHSHHNLITMFPSCCANLLPSFSGDDTASLSVCLYTFCLITTNSSLEMAVCMYYLTKNILIYNSCCCGNRLKSNTDMKMATTITIIQKSEVFF